MQILRIKKFVNSFYYMTLPLKQQKSELFQASVVRITLHNEIRHEQQQQQQHPDDNLRIYFNIS